jgi:hypothetical protein
MVFGDGALGGELGSYGSFLVWSINVPINRDTRELGISHLSACTKKDHARTEPSVIQEESPQKSDHAPEL